MEIEPPCWFHDNWCKFDIVVTVVSGKAEEGDVIEVLYGVGLGRVTTPRIAGKTIAFDALVDIDGTKSGPHNGYTFVEPEVPIEIVPGLPCRMEAYLPSVTFAASTEAAVLVVKKDAYHNCISSQEYPVSASCCRVLRSKNDRASRVEVRDEENSLICRSNPAIQVNKGELGLFWGDLHSHTSISEASIGH